LIIKKEYLHYRHECKFISKIIFIILKFIVFSVHITLYILCRN